MDTNVLRLWFNSVDVDGSGQINCLELQRALAAGNLHFTETIVLQMIKIYDRDLSGTMNFNGDKLVSRSPSEWSRGDYCQRSLRGVEDVRVLLDQPSFYTACQTFDKAKSGRFRLDSYMSLCIFLKSAQNLFMAFDTQRDGRVTLDFNQFVYCAANLRI